jgi:hypothetical protein
VRTIRNTQIHCVDRMQSLYLTGNTLRLQYKAQPVNAVWGSSLVSIPTEISRILVFQSLHINRPRLREERDGDVLQWSVPVGCGRYGRKPSNLNRYNRYPGRYSNLEVLSSQPLGRFSCVAGFRLRPTIVASSWFARSQRKFAKICVL